MTNQEIFDKVAAHLKQQGFSATDGYGHCRYRGPNGSMCAVGCLIPDEYYCPSMEGLGVAYLQGNNELFQEFTRKTKLYSNNQTLNLLSMLQEIHDQAAPHDLNWLDYVRVRLQDLASKFDLHCDNQSWL